MDIEAQYAACLLVAGPPDYIGWGGIGRDDTCPVSTQEYRHTCREWYIDYLGLPCTQREFDDWWSDYKIWILESRIQAEGRERYHRAGHRYG